MGLGVDKSELEKVLRGLEIFHRYEEKDIAWKDDELFAGGEVSDEDKETLQALGWHWDDEYDCWYIWQ
jgi:hypothetical protein